MTDRGGRKKPQPADHNERMRRRLHDRLDQLLDEAVRSRLYGRVALELTFEQGRLAAVHRRLEGVDK